MNQIKHVQTTINNKDSETHIIAKLGRISYLTSKPETNKNKEPSTNLLFPMEL